MWLSQSSNHGAGWALGVSPCREQYGLELPTLSELLSMVLVHLLQRLLLLIAGLVWIILVSSTVCWVDTSNDQDPSELSEGF